MTQCIIDTLLIFYGITNDQYCIIKAITPVKKGKIDFKVEKNGIVHASVGKVSFDAKKISENANELIQTIIKLKPSAAKGSYLKSIYMSSTMGLGIEIDINLF